VTSQLRKSFSIPDWDQGLFCSPNYPQQLSVPSGFFLSGYQGFSRWGKAAEA